MTKPQFFGGPDVLFFPSPKPSQSKTQMDVNPLDLQMGFLMMTPYVVIRGHELNSWSENKVTQLHENYIFTTKPY